MKRERSSALWRLSLFAVALCAVTFLSSAQFAPEPAHAQLPFMGGRPKVPEQTIVSRFEDPAFPAVDPNIPTLTSAGLSASEKPLSAQRRYSAQQLQGIVDGFVQIGPRPTVPARVMMAVSDESEVRSLGDGTIYVTTGYMDKLIELSRAEPDKATNTVLFAMAHEYSHILMRHPQQRSQNLATMQSIQTAFNIVGTAYMFARASQISQGASQNVQQRQAYQALGVMVGASLIGSMVEGEAKRLVFPGFAKNTERDADMMAVDLMQRLGARSNRDIDAITGVDQLSVFFEGNKSVIDKAANLARDAAKTTQSTAASLAVMAPQMMLAKGSTDIGNELKTVAVLSAADFVLGKLDERRRLTDVHLYDSFQRRTELVRAYTAKFYAASAPVEGAPATPPRQTAAGQVDFTRIEQEVVASQAEAAAREALARGLVPDARAAIDTALKSPIATSPEVQRTAAYVCEAENRSAPAITHYRAAIAGGLGDKATYDALIQAHLRLNQRTQALRVIDEAGTALGDPPAFFITKITIFREDQNQVELDKVLTECRALSASRLTLVQQCEAAAAPPAPPEAGQTTTASAAGTSQAPAGAQSLSQSQPPNAAAVAVQQSITKAGQSIMGALRRGTKKGEDAPPAPAPTAPAPPAAPK